MLFAYDDMSNSFTGHSKDLCLSHILLYIISLVVMYLQENRGLVLVKTLTLLVIATYTDSMFPSVCVEAVEKLGKT